MEEERYTRITLRIPRDLHEKLQYEADVSSKSMNAEIVARLEKSFMDEPIDPVSLSGIQEEIHGLVKENLKMQKLLVDHLEFIGVPASADFKKTE